MSFSSMDAIVNAISEGRFFRSDFSKIYTGGTVVAGRWYDLVLFGGTPAQYTYGNKISNGDFLGGYANWTISSMTYWAYTPATHLLTKTAGDTATVSQNTKCVRGQSYSVVFTMTRSAGSITVSLGGTNGTARSGSSTYRETIVCGATANAPLVFTPSSDFAGTIDVVAVTQDLNFHPLDETHDCGLWHGGDVPSGYTKHLLNFSCTPSAALSAPSGIMLVDILGCYPRFVTNSASLQTLAIPDKVYNGTFTGAATGWTLGSGWAYRSNDIERTAGAGGQTASQTLSLEPGRTFTVTYTISNRTAGGVTVSLAGVSGTQRTADGTYSEDIIPTATGDIAFTPDETFNGRIDTVSVVGKFPRYPDGKGVRAFYSISAAPGANARNFVMNYTNTNLTSGRNLGATVAATASSIISHIEYSGVAAGNFGPFLPLMGGDQGITSVQSLQFSAASASAGTANLVICKPLAYLPLSTVSVAAERDLVNQLPSLPEIKNGACLAFILFAGAVVPSGAQYQGSIDVAWDNS